MKEMLMLMGFGAGLVTGALLYKYSSMTKNAVDKGEHCVREEVKELEKKAEAKKAKPSIVKETIKNKPAQ